jgi:hypothetical protein
MKPDTIHVRNQQNDYNTVLLCKKSPKLLQHTICTNLSKATISLLLRPLQHTQYMKSTDHDDHDDVHDDCHHRTQILACILCLLHDAHTKHTLPVLELQPPQLAFQHGVCAHEQDPLSPHASHTVMQQQNIQKTMVRYLSSKTNEKTEIKWG